MWAKLPEARLIYVAIKPSLARWQLAPEMRSANALIEASAEGEPRLTFLDIDAPMIGDDGRPRPELFVADGLHLSDDGYRLWTDLLAPHFDPREPAGPVGELIFPPEHWHNHGSSLVELPNGDLLVAWFHGSGERTADDVRILGARMSAGATTWSAPFLLADTPGFPDTNSTLLLAPVSAGGHRLWLFWPTIQANLWESALMKYKVSTDFEGAGPPVWQWQDVLHMKPGDGFHDLVASRTDEYFRSLGFTGATDPAAPEAVRRWAAHNLEQAADKLTRRLGWFTRAHPVVLPLPSGGQRLLVGLYSDGFSFASATYSDDGGHSWTMSEPIIGGGNIQPAFALRRDGALVAFMRDNGPPPKRAHVAESNDLGVTWSIARDHPDLVETGAGLEVLKTRERPLDRRPQRHPRRPVPARRVRLGGRGPDVQAPALHRARGEGCRPLSLPVGHAGPGRPHPRHLQLPRRRRARRRRPGQEHQARELRRGLAPRRKLTTQHVQPGEFPCANDRLSSP